MDGKHPASTSEDTQFGDGRPTYRSIKCMVKHFENDAIQVHRRKTAGALRQIDANVNGSLPVIEETMDYGWEKSTINK